MLTKRLISLLLALIMVVGLVSARTVKGIVLDENDNEPIVGASVMSQGATTGVATDIDGRFTIKVDDNAKFLTVSYVGMDTQEVPISDVMTIYMKSKAASVLDEVVVVAFGEQKRASFTGSAATVKSEDIKALSTNTPIEALQGKTAGVMMINESGSPVSTPTIQIRGTGSLNASNDPLYIVDGSPMVGSSYLINPEDVESITVLKDAASNALYGARGANGVIMITTKKGKQGEAKITFNAKLSAEQRATRLYDVITDPRQIYELHYAGFYNNEVRVNGTSPWQAHVKANESFALEPNNGGFGYVCFTVPDNEYLIGTNGKMNPNATLGKVVNNKGIDYTVLPDDWADESFRTGLRQDYSANVSGGTNTMNYYATLGYLKNDGIVRGGDFERYTFRFKTDWQLRSWLNLNVNMNYTKSTNNSVSSSLYSITDKYAPIYPVYIRDGQGNIMYDENGKLYDYGDGRVIGLIRPFSNGTNDIQENQLEKRQRVRGLLNITGALNITIPWVKGLKAQIRTNVVQNTSNYVSTNQPFYGSSAISYPSGRISEEATKAYAYNQQQILTYIRQFGQHNINIMVGHEYYKNTTNSLSASKKNMYSYWNTTSLDGAVTVLPKQVSGTNGAYNTEGWLSRVMYDFKDRYFFSASYRRDASSRFHPDHRWGNFYSFGGAWIMSKEEWFPKSPQINMLKIKASWGQQGNDGISDYLYTDAYTIENVNDNVGLTLSTVKGSKDITWETNSNFNAGVEFEFFNNRLSGEIEYFHRKTTDMLCAIGVPLDAGYAYQYDNVGSMRNQGIEISLDYNLINTRNFSWNIYANATHYKNTILSLDEDNKGIDLDGHGGYVDGNYFVGEGLSIHSWYLKKFAGVDHSTGEALYYLTDDSTGEISTTNSYNDATYYYCGTCDPTLYGGFGTYIRCRNLDISASFAYSIGGKAYDGGYASLMSNPRTSGTYSARHKDLLSAWSETNTESNIPRYMYATVEADQFAASSSDRFLTDASSLSIQNINIGYTLPKSILRHAGIERLRVYVSGDNLYYWSKRKGFDPRNSFWGAPSTTDYPLTRKYTVGIELGF